MSVGLRWPSHACYASLAAAPTSYSCFPECQYLSDKQAWLHNSELERHLLALSLEAIFLVGYGMVKSWKGASGEYHSPNQAAGAELVARKPDFRQSPAQLSVGGARLAASVVTGRWQRRRQEAVRGGLPAWGWRRYLRGFSPSLGDQKWRRRPPSSSRKEASLSGGSGWAGTGTRRVPDPGDKGAVLLAVGGAVYPTTGIWA